jgi:hypothetical protein
MKRLRCNTGEILACCSLWMANVPVMLISRSLNAPALRRLLDVQ